VNRLGVGKPVCQPLGYDTFLKDVIRYVAAQFERWGGEE